jgi:hypothetical protein
MTLLKLCQCLLTARAYVNAVTLLDGSVPRAATARLVSLLDSTLALVDLHTHIFTIDQHVPGHFNRIHGFLESAPANVVATRVIAAMLLEARRPTVEQLYTDSDFDEDDPCEGDEDYEEVGDGYPAAGAGAGPRTDLYPPDLLTQERGSDGPMSVVASIQLRRVEQGRPHWTFTTLRAAAISADFDLNDPHSTIRAAGRAGPI